MKNTSMKNGYTIKIDRHWLKRDAFMWNIITFVAPLSFQQFCLVIIDEKVNRQNISFMKTFSINF